MASKLKEIDFNPGSWILQPVLLTTVLYCLCNGNHIKIYRNKDYICLGFFFLYKMGIIDFSPSESLGMCLGAIGLCSVVEYLTVYNQEHSMNALIG